MGFLQIQPSRGVAMEGGWKKVKFLAPYNGF